MCERDDVILDDTLGENKQKLLSTWTVTTPSIFPNTSREQAGRRHSFSENDLKRKEEQSSCRGGVRVHKKQGETVFTCHHFLAQLLFISVHTTCKNRKGLKHHHVEAETHMNPASSHVRVQDVGVQDVKGAG